MERGFVGGVMGVWRVCHVDMLAAALLARGDRVGRRVAEEWVAMVLMGA
jgi:hypothetical protein